MNVEAVVRSPLPAQFVPTYSNDRKQLQYQISSRKCLAGKASSVIRNIIRLSGRDRERKREKIYDNSQWAMFSRSK